MRPRAPACPDVVPRRSGPYRVRGGGEGSIGRAAPGPSPTTPECACPSRWKADPVVARNNLIHPSAATRHTNRLSVNLRHPCSRVCPPPGCKPVTERRRRRSGRSAARAPDGGILEEVVFPTRTSPTRPMQQRGQPRCGVGLCARRFSEPPRRANRGDPLCPHRRLLPARSNLAFATASRPMCSLFVPARIRTGPGAWNSCTMPTVGADASRSSRLTARSSNSSDLVLGP